MLRASSSVWMGTPPTLEELKEQYAVDRSVRYAMRCGAILMRCDPDAMRRVELIECSMVV